MVSGLEHELVQSLRKVLDPLPDGAAIEDSEVWSQASNYLEGFTFHVINEIHPRPESTDGLMATFRHKVGPQEIVVAGNTWMLDYEGNNFVAPFHVQLQMSSTVDEVAWMECRLGERGENSIKHLDWSEKKVAIFAGRAATPNFIDEVDWFYKVTFGERRVASEG
jgi:hypothetical protein